MRRIHHLGIVLPALALLATASIAQAETFSFGIVGDSGMRNEFAPIARDSLADSHITQLIVPGDNLYDTSLDYPDVWGPWRDRGFEFDVVALGNHNLGYAREMAYFGMPGEYFAKEYGSDLLFLVLNSDNTANAGQQARWLEDQLQNATQRFVFLVYHHPSYTLSDRHHWEEKRDFQLAIRPLLWRYRTKLTALILGHDHVASLTDVDGLPLVVSGAATEQLASPRQDYRTDDGHQVRTRWLYNREPTWTRLDVDTTAGTVWINFVRTRPGAVTCSVQLAPNGIQMQPNCQ